MQSFRPRLPDNLVADLAQGGTLLTVNDRLARYLHARYHATYLSAGKQAWQTPAIIPLGAWLGRNHAIAVDLGFTDKPLLSTAQERQLWERIIATDDSDMPLLQPGAAARSAMDAYRLVHQWALGDHPDLASTPEGEAFTRWSARFERHCHAHAGLPACRLPALLTDAVEQGALPLPGVVWLAGFDECSPALQGLLDAMAAAGTTVEILPAAGAAGTTTRFALADPVDERQQVANWALARARATPDARIGIVCPDIQRQREPLRQTLLASLAPESLLPGADRRPLPVNFSLGLPLADQPMIRDALLLLNLAVARRDRDGLSQAELSQLLRSPFVGEGLLETHQRALLDAELKRRGFPCYNLARLTQQLRVIAPDGPLHCPGLDARVAQIDSLLDQQPPQADTRHWADHFRQLLELWGWPGQRGLDSHEYQQHQAFDDVLTELATLARVSTPSGPRPALTKLQQLAGDALFQSEGSDAPIQVLGVLEAAGQHFEHLWVLDLTAARWPPAPAPNPLLPTSLQRHFGLPHASAERELMFSRQIMQRLTGAADELIVSHGQRDADGEQDVSPLIAHLPLGDPATLGLSDPAPPQRAVLEGLDDWLAPAAPTTLAGGTPLLADQAACPFRAFARYRLGARALEHVSHGPDPRLLGNQIHSMLEALWRELGSLAGLRQRNEEALAALIDRTVASVLETTGRARPDLYTPAFVALEQTRLVRLLRDWLDIEQQRQPFTVLRLEQRGTAQVGPLTLKVQADRVDRLLDGRTVVIDYKTGRKQRTATWTADRPEEPQVPLYATNQADPVAAAAIARVRADKDGGFKGLAESDDLLPGVVTFKGSDTLPDWASLQQHWRTRLAALAEEIVAGRADPTPSDQACRYCDLASFCRVAMMDDDGAMEGDDA